MLAEKVYNLNSFKHQYEALLTLSVCDTIPNLIWDKDKSDLLSRIDWNNTLNPQLHSRSATYIKRNGLLIRKITIKSSRPFQCAYHPLTP